MPQLSLFPEGALPLPRAISPMRPAWLREPFDSPDYAFEPLYDGQRALAFLEGGRLRLQSEHLRDLTALWPELQALPDRVCADGVVLDGEVVLADGDGRPRPDLLAARLAGLPAEDAAVRYVARDLLYAGGRPLMGLPWEERRRLLEEVLAPGGPLEAAPSLPGRGVTLFEVARAGGLPGVAARGRWSPYRPGARGAGWAVIRVAPAGEFVIGGYGPSGGRSRPPAWLLLGLYRDGRLIPAGRVAGPFRPDVARTLRARLAAVRAPASPFAGSWAAPGPVRWCRPELVCRVRFAGWTAEGLVRFPLFEGLRPDVPPRACTPQDLPPGP